MIEDKFPVLFSYRRKDKSDGFPDFVKLSALSERQAQSNHSQTLKRLAERGGLSPSEIAANIKGVGWCDIGNITEEEIQKVVRDVAFTTD